MAKPVDTFAAYWAEFEATVMINSGPQERRKARLIFYSGAIALANFVTEKGADPKVTVQRALAIREEFAQFVKQARERG